MISVLLRRFFVGFLLIAGCCLTAGAQSSGDGYNPDSPSEPGQADQLASHNVTVTANIPEAGTVTGTGVYKYGASVTAKATVATGYKFLYWLKDGAEEPFSTNTTVKVTVGTENIALVAVYEKLKAITLTQNDSKAGILSGAGLYSKESTATISVTEYPGYKFLYWTKDGGTKPYSSELSFTYTVEDDDVSFEAVYKLPKTVTLKQNNLEAGTVKYTYVKGATDDKVYARITATANPVFKFRYWIKNSDSWPYTEEPTFDYLMNDDVTFFAVFAYNPDSPAEPNEEAAKLVKYYVNAVLDDADAGIVSGSGKYAYGKTISISTSAKAGYEFKHWLLGEDVYSESPSFSYTVGDKDVTFKAVYEYVGIPEPEPTEHNLYLVASVPGSCTFNKTDGASVKIGSSYSVTANVAADFKFVGWYINNELVESSVTYSGVMGTEDVTLTARCTYNPTDPDDPYALATLNVSSVKLSPSGTFTLIPYAQSSSTDIAWVWKSSDESVATVSEEGVVTAHKLGSAVISVTSTTNSSMYATCEVSVVEPFDANMDGSIDIEDVVFLISILNGAEDVYNTGDVDSNGEINQEDVEYLVGKILGKK